MKLKTLVIVVAVLAIASAATWFFRQQDRAPALDPRIGQPLVSSEIVSHVARVQLDSTTGTTVTLENDATNGSNWVVREYYDLPVDFTKLNTLVQNLRDAKFTRFASRNPERIARMDFNGQRIVLQDAEGETLWSADLGRTLTGGRFIKVNDEEVALVASLTAFIDTTPKTWADAAMVPADAEDVRAIDVAFPDEDLLHFQRENADSPWTAENLPEGATIKTSELSSLLNRLVGLRFTETADPDAAEVVAAREHARHFKLTLAEGLEISIALGRQPAPPAPPAAEEETAADGPTDDATTPPSEVPKPGPVFAFVEMSNDADFNVRMQKRGYQIQEWTFTSLPANHAALLQLPAEPAEPVEASAPESASAVDTSAAAPAE